VVVVVLVDVVVEAVVVEEEAEVLEVAEVEVEAFVVVVVAVVVVLLIAPEEVVVGFAEIDEVADVVLRSSGELEITSVIAKVSVEPISFCVVIADVTV